jgi:hypothetical protein
MHASSSYNPKAIQSQKIARIAQAAMFKKRPYRFYNAKSKLPFGKYQGKTAGEVATKDPGYLINYFFNCKNVTVCPAFKNHVHNNYNK